MDTLISLCKLALNGSTEWALEDFNDNDNELKEIDEELMEAIKKGKKVEVIRFCPTIRIDDIDEKTKKIRVSCVTGYNHDGKNREIVIKRFEWNVDKIDLFLKYVDKNNISTC